MMERSTNVDATSVIGAEERFICRQPPVLHTTTVMHKWRVIALLYALLMVCFYAQGQKVLVKDANTAIVYYGSKPHEFTEYNGLMYFFADSYRKGVELWKSDGTEAGTKLVKDIFSGSSDAFEQGCNMVVLNNALYFMAFGWDGPALWKSDGTEEGTVMVKDPLKANGFFGWRSLTTVNNALYFYVQDYSVNAYVLWKSDGTTAGTVPVGPYFYYITNLIEYNGTLFFQGDGELWKSDGTDAGTVMVSDINPGMASSEPGNFKVFKNELYFSAKSSGYNTELWKSDGTESGTALVKEVNPTTTGSGPFSLSVLNDFMYFIADDGTNGSAIWRTDGTTAGTTLFTDPMPEYSYNDFILGLYNTNGALFYTTQDPSVTYTLWKSDGTAEGTRKLQVDGISNSSGFTTVNNIVFFNTYSPDWGGELWRTDGTQEGTLLVKDISAGTNHSYPSFFFTYKDRLYFQADDAINGPELWTSNGTAEGTYMAAEIYKEASSSWPVNLTKIGNKVFYSAEDGPYGKELWITDGTDAGTHMVKDIHPGTVGSYPSVATDVNGVAYFQATIGNRSLWRSDGTEAGTVMIKEFDLNDLQYLTDLNGVLYFSASQDATGRELWKSDGTPAGTVLVKDIYPGAGNSDPANLINVNGTLYFTARNPDNGVELWKSDGTEAGTVMVKDIFTNASSLPGNFFNANGTLYFNATDAAHGQELWKSDGTEAGTVMVKDINPGPMGSVPRYFCLYQNALYFAAGDDVSGTELWKSNGTPEGTSMVRDIIPGDYDSRPYFLTVFKGELYFVARTVESGYELWKSDGSEAGTAMVKDIWEGNDNSYPGDFRIVNDALYFIAEDDIHDVQVWRTHGVECSTISTTHQTSGYVRWSWMVELNGKLLFSGFTFETGFELFMHDTALDGPSCTQTIAFDPLGEKTYGESKTMPLSAQASSGRSVLFFSENDDVVSIRDNIATINNAGTVTITAKQQGDHIYQPATAQQALKVNKAQQTITFANLPGRTMGDAPFALTATSSSGLPVTYASSNEMVSVIDGNTVALTGRGQTTIKASQPGNRNYEAAPDQQQTLVVDGRNQVIEFAALREKIFGEESFTLSATATSSLPVTYQSSEPSVASISGNTVTLKGAGTTIITAMQEGNHEYNPAAAVVQTLVVNLVTAVEQSPDKTLQVYPNPVTDFLTIGGISSESRSEVFDPAGRSFQVPRSTVNESGFKLDVQHLKPGVYHLKITTNNGILLRTIIKR